ncbi:MAG TPA: ATP-binding protein [Candidatus Eremiobacteraeota bacterium]|nr:MAG: Alkaline phosphatase synthesis sensor protein PhoR [bacterium ADurb.Bin363]HPZ09327.1 ATP-binding protein [Candidatus Eremiobacteraeota bacterium]
MSDKFSSHKSSEELLALYEIAKAINSTLDISEVLELIMNMTIKYLNAEAGSIMLLNEKNELVIKVAHGLDMAKLKDVSVKIGESISGKVALTGEPLLLVGKVDNGEFVNIVSRKEDIKSSLCVPLKVKSQLRGILNLRRASSAKDFTEDQLKFLAMIADEASIAIENARLYDLEKHRAQELEILNRKITFEKVKMEAVLKSLSDGVMVLNELHEIILINPVLEKLFKVISSSVEGKKYINLISHTNFRDLIEGTREGDEVNSIELFIASEDRTFEIVSASIRDLFCQISGKVIIFHDITHIKKIQNMKSDFVSMVTHELRSPLTSIIGFADILLRKYLDKNKRKKYLGIIHEESSRLLDLINNLLNLSRLEAGCYNFKKEELDMSIIIHDAIDMLSAQTEKHNIIFDPKDYICIITGDRDMLYRVIINLLSNAIKYSPHGGDIFINLLDKDKFWEISVIDKGIGIPENVIPCLFEKFYRGDSEIINRIRGIGLGLANVKYILEVHGGSIRVESEIDKGSKFTFYLPKEGKIND